MPKYHISRKGEPAVCRANKVPCKLGKHFTSEKDALNAIATNNNSFGTVTKNQIVVGVEKEPVFPAFERFLDLSCVVDYDADYKSYGYYYHDPYDEDSYNADYYRNSTICNAHIKTDQPIDVDGVLRSLTGIAMNSEVPETLKNLGEDLNLSDHDSYEADIVSVSYVGDTVQIKLAPEKQALIDEWAFKNTLNKDNPLDKKLYQKNIDPRGKTDIDKVKELLSDPKIAESTRVKKAKKVSYKNVNKPAKIARQSDAAKKSSNIIFAKQKDELFVVEGADTYNAKIAKGQKNIFGFVIE